MDTIDLTSYYSGYGDYCENNAKVPFEDYRELEDKIEIYENSTNELEDILEDTEQYGPLEKIKLIKSIIEDLKNELERC